MAGTGLWHVRSPGRDEALSSRLLAIPRARPERLSPARYRDVHVGGRLRFLFVRSRGAVLTEPAPFIRGDSPSSLHGSDDRGDCGEPAELV
jgi:hypothetical protein